MSYSILLVINFGFTNNIINSSTSSNKFALRYAGNSDYNRFENNNITQADIAIKLGWITGPMSPQNNIFVNNTFIKTNYLNHAIIKSYEGLIEEKKYTFYVLFLQINTNKVDVNIHPTKTEVKFEDEKLLYNLMNSSVSRSLSSHHVMPSIDFNADINFSNKTVIEYDNKEYQNIRPSSSSYKQNWKKIFDEVKTEHSNDKLIFENDLIEIQNKPVQFLDNFIFKQLGEKLLVFKHKNCQQRILYEKFKNSSLNSNANSQQNLFPKYIEFNNSDLFLNTGNFI